MLSGYGICIQGYKTAHSPVWVAESEARVPGLNGWWKDISVKKRIESRESRVASSRRMQLLMRETDSRIESPWESGRERCDEWGRIMCCNYLFREGIVGQVKIFLRITSITHTGGSTPSICRCITCQAFKSRGQEISHCPWAVVIE